MAVLVTTLFSWLLPIIEFDTPMRSLLDVRRGLLTFAVFITAFHGFNVDHLFVHVLLAVLSKFKGPFLIPIIEDLIFIELHQIPRY